MISRDLLFGHLVPDTNNPRFVRMVAIIALFVRVSLGLGLLSSGLGAMMAPAGFNGPGAFFGAPTRNMGNATGMEAIANALPYLNLAVGLGLILGAFTTLCSLAAAALTLVPTILMCLGMIIQSGIANGPNSYAGLAFSAAIFGRVEIIGHILVILLSHPSVNVYSVDTLIFASRPALRRAPMVQPPSDSGPQTDATEIG